MVTRQYDDIILADIDENLLNRLIVLLLVVQEEFAKKKKILCNVILTVFGLGIIYSALQTTSLMNM